MIIYYEFLLQSTYIMRAEERLFQGGEGTLMHIMTLENEEEKNKAWN